MIRLLVLALLLLPALTVGCGTSEPFTHAKVSGKVTYEDGSLIPADRIRIVFFPQEKPIDGNIHPKPGIAEVNVADGTFNTVTSHDYGDGLVIGEHKVKIETLNKNEQFVPVIPEAFRDQNTSGITVNTANSPFHIRVPKVEKSK